MDVSLSSWFVILAALLAANLPFFNERIFGCIPAPSRFASAKPFWVRLLEMAVLYFVVGALAYLLESRIGNVSPQSWEFYAISGCLYIVMAYPGFVFRYLRRRR